MPNEMKEAATTSTYSRLLALPIELRHQIYSYEYQVLDGYYEKDDGSPLFAPNLMQTCRQLREEVLRYIRKSNIWIEYTFRNDINYLEEDVYARLIEQRPNTSKILTPNSLAGKHLASQELDAGFMFEMSQDAMMHININFVVSRRVGAGESPSHVRRTEYGFMPYTRIGLHHLCHTLQHKTNAAIYVEYNHHYEELVNNNIDKFVLPFASTRGAGFARIQLPRGPPSLLPILQTVMRSMPNHPLAFQDILLAYKEAGEQAARNSLRQGIDHYEIEAGDGFALGTNDVSLEHAGPMTILIDLINDYTCAVLKYLQLQENVKLDNSIQNDCFRRSLLAIAALRAINWIGMSHVQRAIKHAIESEIRAWTARFLSDPRKEKIARNFDNIHHMNYMGEAEYLQMSVDHATYAQAAHRLAADTILDLSALEARRSEPFIQKVKVGRRVLLPPNGIWYGDPHIAKAYRRFPDHLWCIPDEVKMYEITTDTEISALQRSIGFTPPRGGEHERPALWRLLGQ